MIYRANLLIEIIVSNVHLVKECVENEGNIEEFLIPNYEIVDSFELTGTSETMSEVEYLYKYRTKLQPKKENNNKKIKN